MTTRVQIHALLVALAMFLFAGCGGTYLPEDAQHLSSDEAVFLDWSWDCEYCIEAIDGIHHESFKLGTAFGGNRRAKLKPGLHTIMYRDTTWCLRGPSSYDRPASGMAEINLNAGHRYKLRWCKRQIVKGVGGECFAKTFIWFEDQSTGEIVGGYKPPDCDKSGPIFSFGD